MHHASRACDGARANLVSQPPALLAGLRLHSSLHMCCQRCADAWTDGETYGRVRTSSAVGTFIGGGESGLQAQPNVIESIESNGKKSP